MNNYKKAFLGINIVIFIAVVSNAFIKISNATSTKERTITSLENKKTALELEVSEAQKQLAAIEPKDDNSSEIDSILTLFDRNYQSFAKEYNTKYSGGKSFGFWVGYIRVPSIPVGSEARSVKKLIESYKKQPEKFAILNKALQNYKYDPKWFRNESFLISRNRKVLENKKLPKEEVALIVFLDFMKYRKSHNFSKSSSISISNNSSKISDKKTSINKSVSSTDESSAKDKASNSRISPEQAVIEQYSLINKRQYKDAWNRLSPQMRNNRAIFTNGYDSYQSWWKTVKRIEVKNPKTIDSDNKNATVGVNLTYHMQNGKVTSESRDINLSWNNESEKWLVVKAKK